MIERLAKRDIIIKYLWFIAGLQISAGVQLFANIYFVELPIRALSFILVSGFALGLSGFMSLVLAGEFEHVVKAGEFLLGTTLEKDKEQKLDEELDKTVSMILLGSMKRIKKIRIIFWLDIVLSVLCLGMSAISTI